MKKTIKYLIGVAIVLISLELLALLQSCTRIERDDPGVPAETAEGINFAPQIASTKALLNKEDLAKGSTKIAVYDYLSGFTGKIGNVDFSSTDDKLYFSNKIQFNDNGTTDVTSDDTWPYYDPVTVYPWTKTGLHTFMGWLLQDKNGLTADDLFIEPSNSDQHLTFNENTRVLTVPATEMKHGTPQFDFSYAVPLEINAATRTPGTPVPLQLRHFFSAFKLTLKNTSGNTILLKSVRITGLKNNRSATIDFKNDPPTVSTNKFQEDGDGISIYTYSGEGDGYRIISRDFLLDKLLMNDYMLMWPQTFAELAGAQIEVKYKVRSYTEVNGVAVDSTDSAILTANGILNRQDFFRTNSTGMDAGTKYDMMIQFKRSSLDILTRALPWEYEEYDLDYSQHSISARGGMFKDGVLAFYRKDATTGEYTVEPTDVEWSAKTMRFLSSSEVLTGRFYIEAPTSGEWQVTPYPMSAAQYFIITPSSGQIDAYTDNGKVEFTVSLNPSLTPTASQTLYFNVAIRINGEWVDANSEFNRKNFKLVRDAN